MKKQIMLPKAFSDLRIEEEDGYYHFWLDERCVGYAWKTNSGFATADKPLINLVRSMTPYIQSFQEQINWIDSLKDIELDHVVLLNNRETLFELQSHCNIYEELLRLKTLASGFGNLQPQKLILKQAEESLELMIG